MNLCFLIGKIVSDIKFDFILNSKNISIVRFEVELSNKSTIKVKGYNNVADFCYNKLEINNKIFIFGSLYNNRHIIINYLQKW